MVRGLFLWVLRQIELFNLIKGLNHLTLLISLKYLFSSLILSVFDIKQFMAHDLIY